MIRERPGKLKGRAFKWLFGPGRWEFKQPNFQNFKFPGGGGMLKLRIDGCISSVNTKEKENLKGTECQGSLMIPI